MLFFLIKGQLNTFSKCPFIQNEEKTLLTIIYYYCILLSNTIINAKLVNAKINALFEFVLLLILSVLYMLFFQ